MQFKQILFFSFLTFLTSSCNTYKFINTPFYDDDFGGYNGQPKSMEFDYIKFEKENGKTIERKPRSRDVYEYDEKGRFIKRFSVGKSGGRILRSEAKYLKNGRLESVMYNINESIGKRFYYYKYKRNKLRSIKSNITIEHFEYDKNGFISKKIFKNLEKDYVQESFYINNESGLPIETITFDKNNKFNRKYKSQYDNRGNMVKMIRFDRNNNLKSIIEKQFDNHNNEIYQQQFSIVNNDTILKHTSSKNYKYDDKFNPVQITEFREGELYNGFYINIIYHQD